MRSKIKSTTCWLLLVVSTTAQAIDREVSISLEEMPGAASYEVEVARGSGQFFKRLSFSKSEFNVPLKVGRYLIRTRSLDMRKIAGPWSEWESITIPPPKINFAMKDHKPLTASGETLSAELQLKWHNIAEVEKYKINVISSDGQKILEKEVTANELKIDLPPGDYTIQLASFFDGVESEEKDELKVQVQGAKLSPVEIQDVELTKEGLQISWKGGVPNALYAGRIERQDIGADDPNDWESVFDFNSHESNILKLPADLTPGNYRMKISTTAKSWQPSEGSFQKFTIKPKDRELSSIKDEIKTEFDFSKISN